jgi:3-oxoadipate enol-lactonase
MRIPVNGVGLETDVEGEGPAVLFVHGFPLDRTIWGHQMQGLGGWCRIAPDLRGMGRSDVPDLGYSMETYASDLSVLLDTLEIDRVVMCGLSMGGYIAFEFLRRWPQRVVGLVLMDTRAEPETAEGRRGRDTLIAAVRAQGAKAVADAMMPRLVGETTRLQAPEVVARVRDMVERIPLPGMVGALKAMRDRADSGPLLPTLTVPTLVLVGNQDALTPPTVAASMAKAIPGSRIEVVEGAGHLPPVEQPARTTDALRRFLESVSPPAT